jgi:hypothetical protein
VKETIEYYCKGKRIEISKEVKTCDLENGGIMNLRDRLNNIGNIFDEEFITTSNDILSKANISGILPGLPNKTVIEPTVGNIIIPAQEIKGGYTCNVSVNKYIGNMSLHPETDRMKLYVLGNKMKIETSNNIDIYLDDDTMSKNLCYKESQTIESVRYDGNDYIPELSNIEFVKTGSTGIGRTGCDIYEKISNNKKTVLKIYESKDTKLPQKIVLTNGTNTIEITYTNYSFNTVTNSDVTFK